MLIKNSLVYSCWAASVIGAFWIGTLGENLMPSGDPSASENSKSKLSGSDIGTTDSDRILTKSAKRNPAGQDSAAISRLFGSSSQGESSLENLATQAFSDPNPINRRLAFSQLLESLTPENAMEIRSQMVALGAGGDEWRDFHFSWGALAGKSAFDIAATTEERDLAATFSGWAAANPSEALAMLDNLPEAMKGQRQELAESVVSGLASHDPSLATDLVLRLQGEGDTSAAKLIEIIANQTLLTGGPAEASRWSESLPDGPVKSAAMDRVAAAYVRQDPVAAARWAERHADQDYATAAIEEVGRKWAQQNPVEAVNWLDSLPQGNGQAAGLRSAFGDWEDSDPAAASKYLLDMPSSAKRDSAISGFSTGYAWQNPTMAIQWAESISDPALRQETLTQAGQAYFRRDPDSARAWLETSNLPAEAQQQVLNRSRR